MSKQSSVGLIVTLAIFLASPVDATAGGFGIFKRCRAKQTTCCPPPACTPCAPAPCAPIEVACEPETSECWQGIGTGVDGNGQPVTHLGNCTNSPYAAMYDVYYHFMSQRWTLYTCLANPYTPCPCPTVVGSEQLQGPDANGEIASPGAIPGNWSGHLEVTDRNGNRVIRRRANSSEDIRIVLFELNEAFRRYGDRQIHLYSVKLKGAPLTEK